MPLVIGGVLALQVSAAQALIAWLVKPVMDDIFLKQDLVMLRIVPFIVLGAYVLKGLGRYGQSYLMAAVGERVIARIRRDLYAHIQGMSLSFFSSVHSGELVARTITDVNRVARLASTVLVNVVRDLATAIGLLVVMFMRDWTLALIAAAVFPFIGITVRALSRSRAPRPSRRSDRKPTTRRGSIASTAASSIWRSRTRASISCPDR